MGAYNLKLVENTGLGLLWRRRFPTLTNASFEDCTALYQRVQHHNKLFGWWSISLLLWNGLSIRSNRKAYEKIVAMERQASTQQ